MYSISLDVVQTAALGVAVYGIGRGIRKRVRFLQKYFIPAPVVGGLLCSIIVFILVQGGIAEITFDGILQDFFMNVFFTCTGFTVSIPVIKKSGRQGAVLAVVAVLFLAIQNLVGVGLCQLLGINKLLGIAMGSISMSGGVGSAAHVLQFPSKI